MHNRQPITPRLLWQSMLDYDIWPLYIIGVLFQIPQSPLNQYLTLTLKELGFSTFKTNLLVIPSTFLQMIILLIVAYAAEIVGNLTLAASFTQIWVLPFVVYIYSVDITKINKWKAFGILSLLVSCPSRTSPVISSSLSLIFCSTSGSGSLVLAEFQCGSDPDRLCRFI